MSSGAFMAHGAVPVADSHLSGSERDRIAAAAARLPGTYRVEVGPGTGFFAWCSAVPAPGCAGPTFSFCRYGGAIMLLITDRAGHKSVVTSMGLQEAIGAMAAAAGGHPPGTRPPGH